MRHTLERLRHIRKIAIVTALSTVIWIGLTLTPAASEDLSGPKDWSPRLGGDVLFRLTHDGAYAADAPRFESNDTSFEMIASPVIDVTGRVSVIGEFRIEDIERPTGTRAFDDLGLFVRSLYGSFQASEDLQIRAGKFTPSFAIASLVTPGMYGNNYSKEIELIERVGIEAEFGRDAGSLGRYAVTASTFFDDTSIFSDSAINNRGRTSIDDGGASNTESFESFTTSLQGTDIDALPGFLFKLGFIHQAAGEGDAGDETGFAVAATQSMPLGDDHKLTLIGEVAPLWNFEGSADSIVYTSAGVVYGRGPWTLVASGTHRWRDNATGENFNDFAQQTSIEYAFGDGYSAAIAHECTRDQEVDSQRVGLRLIKVFDLDE